MRKKIEERVAVVTPGCHHRKDKLLQRERVEVEVRSESGKPTREAWVLIRCLECNAVMLPRELYHILDHQRTADIAQKMGLVGLSKEMKKRGSVLK